MYFMPIDVKIDGSIDGETIGEVGKAVHTDF